jgi:hypothetical protein
MYIKMENEKKTADNQKLAEKEMSDKNEGI